MTDWQPGASLDTLRMRAALLASIRNFFAARNILEVETPLLAPTTGTDIYIQSYVVADTSAKNNQARFLQTSPEFAMKRLLATGSGPIYQLCKAFRQEETSTRHNSEFTMLEWYRPGFSMFNLMDEVEALLQKVLECEAITRISYRDLFLQHLQFDPHQINFDDLRELARTRIDFSSDDLSATDYLQMLLAKFIEPVLPEYCFIYDYPIAQSALARIDRDDTGTEVARRFELFGKGMEIANGYFELTDANEQRKRFEHDNSKRKQLGLPEYPVDEKLLAALASGIPPCSGVALGLDRLLMLQLGLDDIRQAISFSAK